MEEKRRRQTRIAQQEANEKANAGKTLPQEVISTLVRALPGLANTITVTTTKGDIKVTPIGELGSKPLVAINAGVLSRVVEVYRNSDYYWSGGGTISKTVELIQAELQRRSKNSPR